MAGAAAEAIAADLLATFGSLGAVFAADPSALHSACRNRQVAEQIAGAGRLQRRILRERVSRGPVLGNMRALVEFLSASTAFGPVEQVRALYLNARLELILDEIVSRGCVSEAPIFARPILKRALDVGATSLILAHNHPSGNPLPSEADRQATMAVAAAARTLGIELVDHFILARGEWTSMRAEGMF